VVGDEAEDVAVIDVCELGSNEDESKASVLVALATLVSEVLAGGVVAVGEVVGVFKSVSPADVESAVSVTASVLTKDEDEGEGVSDVESATARRKHEHKHR
jgi:hypothetical protein